MIQQILVIALVTLGYCCTFWEEMILQRVGEWMECNAPQWIWKPLGGCYICACMWIGSIVYWILYNKPYPGGGITVNVVDWFITCVGAMGVNAGISLFVDKGDDAEIIEPEAKVENHLKEIIPNKKGSEGD